jgi:hypothetical protein
MYTNCQGPDPPESSSSTSSASATRDDPFLSCCPTPALLPSQGERDLPLSYKTQLDSQSNTTGTNESVPLMMTSRFEHKIGDDGQHLILTGRNGVLEKCEDEPIQAPGAIQAFGVLIAFDHEANDQLVVKQVSKNSGFVIGLPPKKLFGNKSFTEYLNPNQADILLDAIDALDDRDNHQDNTDLMPIDFTLSGYGIAGTGTLAGPNNWGRVK